MAQFLLITTLLSIAGLISTSIVGFIAAPGHVAQHIFFALATVEALQAGADRGGRKGEDIDRPQLVVCSLDEDREVALDRARELLTQYLGQQPHIMKASGVDPELIEEIGRVMTWPAGPEEIHRAMKLVPDEAVQMISASGTPEECRAKVREYVEAGCTCPILYPLGDDVEAMIDAFAVDAEPAVARG